MNEMDTLIDRLKAGPSKFDDLSDKERIDSVLNHPLFMDSIHEEDMEKDTLTAIQSLVFEGTREEKAENFKINGNSCFALGKLKYKDAISFYTQGITSNSTDQNTNSILHSNRAAVNLELGNFRSVLYDCGRAIKLNPNNMKAYFRSMKALLALDRIEEGIDCVQVASKIENKPEFQEMLSNLQTRKLTLDQLAIKEKKKTEKREFNENELKKTLLSRGYLQVELTDDNDEKLQLQHPEAKLNKIELINFELSFPVAFLYPEFNQSDFISQFLEDDSFYNHFENMFSTKMEWDLEFNYNPQNIDWYYVTQPEKYKGDQSLVSCLKSVKVKNVESDSIAHRYVGMTLRDCLETKGFPIINGVVTFVVMSRNSEFNKNYRRDFKAV
jgi:hypothetical protein